MTAFNKFRGQKAFIINCTELENGEDVRVIEHDVAGLASNRASDRSAAIFRQDFWRLVAADGVFGRYITHPCLLQFRDDGNAKALR